MVTSELKRLTKSVATSSRDASLEKSKEGRLENKLPSPGLSKLPLMQMAKISPNEMEEARKANRTEAAADLDASISSASDPDHEPDPKPVDAAKETAK